MLDEKGPTSYNAKLRVMQEFQEAALKSAEASGRGGYAAEAAHKTKITQVSPIAIATPILIPILVLQDKTAELEAKAKKAMMDPRKRISSGNLAKASLAQRAALLTANFAVSEKKSSPPPSLLSLSSPSQGRSFFDKDLDAHVQVDYVQKNKPKGRKLVVFIRYGPDSPVVDKDNKPIPHDPGYVFHYFNCDTKVICRCC